MAWEKQYKRAHCPCGGPGRNSQLWLGPALAITATWRVKQGMENLTPCYSHFLTLSNKTKQNKIKDLKNEMDLNILKYKDLKIYYARKGVYLCIPLLAEYLRHQLSLSTHGRLILAFFENTTTDSYALTGWCRNVARVCIMAQQVNLPFHILAASLLFQLPADAPRKAAEGSPNAWAPALM